jgi:hypothetical protein
VAIERAWQGRPDGLNVGHEHPGSSFETLGVLSAAGLDASSDGNSARSFDECKHLAIFDIPGPEPNRLYSQYSATHTTLIRHFANAELHSIMQSLT